ncbi:MAG: ribonuclease P protein component [bacterium]
MTPFSSRYSSVSRRGRVVYRPGLTVKCEAVRTPTKPRIVISQKVDKRAVVRNRLRRQVREILRKLPTPGLAITVITKKETLSLTSSVLKQHLTTAINQIK